MRTMLPHWWLILALGSIIMGITSSYALVTLSTELLYEVRQKGMVLKYALFYTGTFVAIIPISILMESLNNPFLADLIPYLLESMIVIWLILFYYRKNKGNLITIASSVFICFFYITNFTSVFIIFSEKFMLPFYQSEYFFIQMMIPVFQNIVGVMGSLVILLILRKSNFRKYFASLFIKKRNAITTLIGCFLLMHSEKIISSFYPAWMDSTNYLAFGVSIGFVILLLMLIIAILETNSIKMKSQKALMVQQQAYVYSLEKMQEEMRSFRHDYKNMMSGLYLQVNQGDITGTQDFLKSSLNYFEHNLGEEIKLMTQLSNISIMEIKSFLIVKQMEMQKKDIAYHLEILKGIEIIQMQLEDFLRCLGILLDNALEAAELSNEKYMSLLLLNTDKELIITVENTYQDKPILHKIWEQGHSTKGTGRGLGLSSYQGIVDRYQNVMTRTECNDKTFLQELKIGRAQ